MLSFVYKAGEFAQHSDNGRMIAGAG